MPVAPAAAAAAVAATAAGDRMMLLLLLQFVVMVLVKLVITACFAAAAACASIVAAATVVGVFFLCAETWLHDLIYETLCVETVHPIGNHQPSLSLGVCVLGCLESRTLFACWFFGFLRCRVRPRPGIPSLLIQGVLPLPAGLLQCHVQLSDAYLALNGCRCQVGPMEVRRPAFGGKNADEQMLKKPLSQT